MFYIIEADGEKSRERTLCMYVDVCDVFDVVLDVRLFEMDNREYIYLSTYLQYASIYLLSYRRSLITGLILK